jgi:hypothetical protein
MSKAPKPAHKSFIFEQSCCYYINGYAKKEIWMRAAGKFKAKCPMIYSAERDEHRVSIWRGIPEYATGSSRHLRGTHNDKALSNFS